MLRHGIGAPLWRAIVSLETSTLLNVVAALLAGACFAYAVRKLLFWADAFDDVSGEDEDRPFPKAKYVQFFVFFAFLLFPPFANSVTRLSPLMTELLPPLASLAVVASLNSKFKDIQSLDDEYLCDGRKFLWLRLLVSGALAAVGAWESTIGVVLTLFILMSICLRFIRRQKGLMVLFSVWFLGFAIGFAAEGYLLHWPLLALKPIFRPFIYLAVFAVACGIPLAAVRHFGENRWTTIGWASLLALFAAITYVGDGTRGMSASERFVRMVLGDLGERKIVIGDGVFDIMVDEFKPADVRLVRPTSVEDREFLLNAFDDGEPVSNKAVVVKSYYDADEMKAAAKELGLVLATPAEIDKQERNPHVEKLQSDLERSLQLMDDDKFAEIPKSKKLLEINAARSNVRKAWEEGVVGLQLSSTLLALDMMLGDVKSAEHDAIAALFVDRNDPAANVVLGALRLRQGRYELAEKYLERGIVGGGAGGLNDYAVLLLRTNRAAEAETWARQAVGKKPEDWNIRETLAMTLIELGRFDEAEAELVEVSRLAKKNGAERQAGKLVDRDRERIKALKASGK